MDNVIIIFSKMKVDEGVHRRREDKVGLRRCK